MLFQPTCFWNLLSALLTFFGRLTTQRGSAKRKQENGSSVFYLVITPGIFRDIK
jgi:hypothetical protein